MMTPEEIKAHAADIQAKYYAPPAEPIMSPVAGPIAAPVPPVQSDMPPAAPVTDGSQEPVQVTPAVPGQRVQTASAFNVGRPEITAGDLATEGDKTSEALLNNNDAVATEQKQVNKDQAKLESDVAEAQAPVEELHQRELAQQVADQEDAQMQAEADAKKHFDVLMTYNKEIEDHVANQPTDLWGRAGVNKVAGIIGLVLGGLGGGATGGKNLVVDTLDTLVSQNLRQNEYKYEMLKGKVSAENTAYAQVRQTSHDKQEAADRYSLISLNQYQQQMKQAAGQFAGQQAKVRAAQADATIDAKKAELEQKIYSDRLRNHTAAAQIGIATRGQDLQSVQLQQAEREAKGKEQEGQYLPGYILPTGVKIPPSEVQQLREQQGGAAQVQDIMNDMHAAALVGGWDAVLANKSAASDLKVALIKQKKLSNRISKDEGAALDGMIGFLTTGHAADLMTATGLKTPAEALRKAQSKFAKQWVTNITHGYGYVPTPDNPFVKAANGDFGDDETANAVGGPAGGGDPIASMKSRSEQVQAAAMDARNKMSPAGYNPL